MRTATIVSILLFSLIEITPIWALTPDQVVVVANKMAWHSVDLAKYYMKVRDIPSDNLIQLKATSDEICSREDYDKDVASPVKAFLEKNDPAGHRFHCLVTMYGVPLRVLAPKLTSKEQEELLGLQKQLGYIRGQIKKEGPEQGNRGLKSLKEEEAKLKKEIDHVNKVFQGASVDSELALVRENNCSLEGWLPNKYFLGYRGKEIKNMPQKVMLVSRLDGPSEEIVRRIINDSLQAEKEGLQGKAYFDARWPDPGNKELNGTAFYRSGDSQNSPSGRKKQAHGGCYRLPAEAFSTGRVSVCSTLLRMVQLSPLCGRIYLGKGRCGVSYR